MYSQGSDPRWNRDYAWGGDSIDILMDVIETPEDFSVLSGGHTSSSSSSEVNRNGFGGSDFWLIEEDTLGQFVWNQLYGGDTTELFAEIVELPNGYLLAGSSLSGVSGNKTASNKGGFDYWVVKVDKDGNKEWDRTFGGSGDDLLKCAQRLNNGNIVLGGSSNSNAGGDKSDDSKGGVDYWMVVISDAGDLVWDNTFGGDSTDIMMDIYVENGIYVAGSSNSDQSGDKSRDSYGGYDYWIINLDPVTGAMQWDSTYGGIADDLLENVVKHEQNSSFYVSGTSESSTGGSKNSGNYGGQDFWVLNLDSVGGLVWELNLGGSGTDVLTDMIPSPEGAVIVGGYSNSGASGNKTSGNIGGFDYWIVKIDTLGAVYWDHTYGGNQNDTLQSLFMRCDRGLLLGGHSSSGISGDRTYFNRGHQDYWVISLDVPTIARIRAEDHCYGLTLNHYDDSEIWPDKWEWDFGDPNSGANTSTEQHPLHQYSAPGNYTITLTVKEGCQKDTFDVRTITVFENRILGKSDLEADKTLCYGETLELENNPDVTLPSDVTYLWSTGDTSPVITIDTVGKYALTLTAGNCYETDTVEIDHCPLIYVPNAFTPNEDGTNDEWGFKGVGIREFYMVILDRWGNQVFEANHIDDWWDGTFKGRQVQIDVYVYIAEYRGLNTNAGRKVGTVTLVR